MDDYEDISIIYKELSPFCQGIGWEITVLDVEEALRSLIIESLVDVFRSDQKANSLERQANFSFSSEIDVRGLYFLRSQSGKKLIQSLPEDWLDSINNRFTISPEE